MGRGFWYGDKNGGNTYRGDITNLTVDEAGDIAFDYTYTNGAVGSGRFTGRIVNDYLDGTWTERCDGSPYTGTSQVMRRIKPLNMADGFRGSYRVTSRVPPKKDDIGIWTIEFDV